MRTAKTQAYADEESKAYPVKSTTQNICAAQPDNARTLCHKLLSWSGQKNWKSSRMRLCAKPKLLAQKRQP